jgi:probable O-glycosylation ligase (exosortase A-associated)
MVLVPALLVGYVLFEMRKFPPRLRGMVLLLTFWAWLSAAAVLAYDTHPAFDMLWRFSRMFTIAFLIAAMASSEERIRKILVVIAGSLGFLGMKSLAGVIVTAGQYRVQGPGGLMAEENEYALGMNMAIPILYWLGTLEDRHWAKRLYQLAALSCAVSVIFTRSRSGFLGLIMVCLLIAVHSRRKVRASIGLAIVVVLFLAFAPDASMDRYKSIPTATQTDASAIGRIQAWETAIEMVKAHPVFGVGLRNFEVTFLNYSSFEPRAPHNAFVALMAESGIPSCLLFAALVLGASTTSWLNWRRLRHSPDHRVLATCCLIVHVTLLVYLVPNFFINRQDFDLMYHLVGLSAGMDMVVKHKLNAALAAASEPGFDVSQAQVAAQ